MRARALGAFLLLTFAIPAGALPKDGFHKDGFHGMAGKFAEAARKHAKKRAAIVTFSGVTGRHSLSGAVISERLGQRILASGSLDLLERDVLDKAFESKTGVVKRVTPAIALVLGKALGIDALITGTVLELRDGRIEVNARMIDTESGKVLAASTSQVEKDWSNFAEDSSPFNMPVPEIPSLDKAPIVHVTWNRNEQMREIEVTDCASGRLTLHDTERQLVDIKARYWAIKLKDRDFAVRSLKRNPGSEIADPELKEFFYSRLRYWHQEDYTPPLTRAEYESFANYQKFLEKVANACGI